MFARLLCSSLVSAAVFTTLSPLVQLVGKLRDVDARVRLDEVAGDRDEPSLRAALISAISQA